MSVSLSILHSWFEYGARSESRFACYPILLRRAAPLNVKGRYARDALPHAFNIGVFKSVKMNSATRKQFCNETNIIEGCNVAFDNINKAVAPFTNMV